MNTLQLHRDDRNVLKVSLNRPQVRNAFNEELIRELTQVFTDHAKDPKTRIVVFSGQGPAFSAGGDLNWMKKSIELSYEDNLKDTRNLTALFQLMNEFPKPIVGRIHSAAIGGGVGLTSVCDYAIATANTVFSLSEVKLGIIPACIGPFVVGKIGPSHARALFMSAERFSAQKAYEVGLIHEIAADEAALDQAVERIVSQMLECGPNALAAAKRLILDLTGFHKPVEKSQVLDHVAKMLAELRVSPEGQEGLKAFLEKRNPSWKG